MPLVLEDIRVIGRHGPLLELSHLDLDVGECVLMAGEPGDMHAALALTATGRLKPETGQVKLVADDGRENQESSELRRVTAVVDLPEVSEPDDALSVGSVVAEDLALARKSASPGSARRWLARHVLAEHQGTRMDALDGAVRTAMLTALAVERVGVRYLVLALPDRHGGEPFEWWDLAQSYAALGYGVLVQCTPSSARDIGADLPPTRSRPSPWTTPVEALRLRPQVDVRQPDSPERK